VLYALNLQSYTCHVFLKTGKKKALHVDRGGLQREVKKQDVARMARLLRGCRDFASLISWDAGEEVMENESRRGGRTGVLDGDVCHEKLIEFPANFN